MHQVLSGHIAANAKIAKESIRFLYDPGRSGCSSAFGILRLVASNQNPCHLINDLVVAKMAAKLRSEVKAFAGIQLDRDDIERLCRENRHVIPVNIKSPLVGFDSGRAELTPKMQQTIS